MSLIEIDWHPGARQLRIFGLSALVASIILAAVLRFIWGVSPIWALLAMAAGAGILLCSLISLRATRAVYLTLTVATMPIGVVMSFVLLGVFYFLLLTPIALFFRLIGRDPLHLRFDRKEETYWVPHRSPANVDRYFHQS
jgi:hypothetical protein